VAPDTTLFQLYHRLIALRQAHQRLFVDGTVQWLRRDDANGVLVYARTLGEQRAVVAFNVSAVERAVAVPADGSYREAFPGNGAAPIVGGRLSATLPPGEARVWIRGE
jgi:glycosidase